MITKNNVVLDICVNTEDENGLIIYAHKKGKSLSLITTFDKSDELIKKFKSNGNKFFDEIKKKSIIVNGIQIVSCVY